MGWSAEGVWFWTGGYQEFALKHSIVEDTVSVMNLGIIFVAVIASRLAGRFAPTTQLPWRPLATAVICGLRSPDRLRLQYRRLIFGGRLNRPSWLTMDRNRVGR
ncbi:MAG: hypothetical protein VXX79_16960, partial [Pseudomonadota bacterium]|nr:hypothetical protein [Pseudomonadota bacterium]